MRLSLFHYPQQGRNVRLFFIITTGDDNKDSMIINPHFSSVDKERTFYPVDKIKGSVWNSLSSPEFVIKIPKFKKTHLKVIGYIDQNTENNKKKKK